MAVKTRVLPLTKERQLEELTAFVAICFATIAVDDLKEVANLSGLSFSTVNRLWRERFTLRVQFRTIQNLAAAAGLQLDWTPYAMAVRLVA